MMVMVILTMIADGDCDDGDGVSDSDTSDGDDYGGGDHGDNGIGGDKEEDGDQMVVIMMVVWY